MAHIASYDSKLGPCNDHINIIGSGFFGRWGNM